MDASDLERITSIIEEDVKIEEVLPYVLDCCYQSHAPGRKYESKQVTHFDKKIRIVVGVLNKIHSTPSESVPELIDSVRSTLYSCKEVTLALYDLVPTNQFWRYKDNWCNSLRSSVFAAALIEYLEHHRLITLPQVCEILGIKDEWKDRFALSVEDYLLGVISLVNELSRLAINAVTMGNFEEPIRISVFVKDVFAGFSVLNLKNDILRRRFDSLKYDLKKIEEVVYDVSLRKLAPAPKVKSVE